MYVALGLICIYYLYVRSTIKTKNNYESDDELEDPECFTPTNGEFPAAYSEDNVDAIPKTFCNSRCCDPNTLPDNVIGFPETSCGTNCGAKGGCLCVRKKLKAD
jgi:Ca2+/Na+ antiporter